MSPAWMGVYIKKRDYLKKNTSKITLVLFFIACFFGLPSCADKNEGKKGPFQFSKSILLIEEAELEKAGFYHLDSFQFYMLVKKEFIYLLNQEDKTVARFTREGKADRKYHAEGQGPGEMIVPMLIFSDSINTLAVLDIGRIKLIFFDLELNFKGEKTLDNRISKIIRNNGKTYAFGDFGDYFLAILNDDYRVMKSFKEKPMKLPFEGILPYSLFMGYLLCEDEIAATSWGYFLPECKVEIIDIDTLKTKTTLKWKHPDPPDQAEVLKRRKLYSSYYINKHAGFYVVQTHFNEKINSETQKNLLIFKEDGRFITDMEIHFDLISVYESNGSNLYFMDENGNIKYLDMKEFKD